jgi:hypothetical protein
MRTRDEVMALQGVPVCRTEHSTILHQWGTAVPMHCALSAAHPGPHWSRQMELDRRTMIYEWDEHGTVERED